MPESTSTPTATPAPTPEAVVSTVVAAAAPVVAEAKVETTSILKSIGTFLTSLWSKAVSFENSITSKFTDLKTTSSILIGFAMIVGAGFLELTGVLRVLDIVPAIVKFIGSIGKLAISLVVLSVSGLVSLLQIVLPLILVGIGVYLLVTALKKKA